jgi:hypothetical protein
VALNKDDIGTIVEAGVISGANAMFINEWLNVAVAGVSLVYLGYKTHILHKNHKRDHKK